MSEPFIPKPPFKLSHTQRTSDTWAVLRLNLQAELDMLRNKNDSDLDPVQTAKIRGQISHVKAMLALEKDLPIQSPDS